MQTQHCREGAAPSRPGHVLLHSWPSDKISSLVLLLLLLKQCTQNFFKNLCLCFCSGHIHLNLYVAYIKGNERRLKEKLRNLITCLIMEQSFLSYTIMNYYSSANDTGPVYSNQYQQTMLLADIIMQSSKDRAETALL